MAARSQTKTSHLNIRMKPEVRAKIELAANASGKSVSDFVRDAATREAENTLLDRTRIELNQADWERFITALDAPPTKHRRLRDLMSRKAVWDR
ncbi:MAG: DUF1778 domain-containing protein [Hyphomicrobiales bacterium]|nr:DUF1778 domain-containing protein [Hyphomicrobiales bacterium]